MWIMANLSSAPAASGRACADRSQGGGAAQGTARDYLATRGAGGQGLAAGTHQVLLHQLVEALIA